jgi:hypothetical protein
MQANIQGPLEPMVPFRGRARPEDVYYLTAILGEGENPTGSAILVLVQSLSNLKFQIHTQLGS